MIVNTAVYGVLAAILDAAATAVAATSGGPPQTATVVPGAVAWDSCDCGQLTVTWSTMHLSDRFPADLKGEDQLRPPPCGAALLVTTVAVEMIRCAPSPEGTDVTVRPDRLDASARVVAEDAVAILQGVACALEDMEQANTIYAYQLLGQTAKGPQGGCVGSELELMFGLRR